MKSFRILLIPLLIAVVMLLQSCGGGGTSDTAGSLTISAPTSTDNGDNTYTVSATVTYAPPSGKSAQGVVISITATDSFGGVITGNPTLTSGSNSVTYTFLVGQRTSSNHISIVASIGGMNASVGLTIPAKVPALGVSTISVAFADSSLAVPPAQTVDVTGGIKPYSVSSSDPLLKATVLDGTVTISVLNVAATSPGTAATATVTVTDSSAVALTKTITVTYFK